MGNYTSIEKEYIDRLDPQIKVLFDNHQQNTDVSSLQLEKDRIISKTLLEMRVEKMQELCRHTNRNLICYFSAWLQSPIMNPDSQINDNDMNGFMNAVSGIEDRSKGLDLLLHTPGGVVTATESLVNYLRKMFDMDIRVIVPHMAMSAGTMIACSSKEILMGKESSLGPIDPQYYNVPAQGVLKEFEKAIEQTEQSPNKALIWREIIQQYRPTFLGECENIINMSHDLAEGWLLDCMFNGRNDANEVVKGIMDEIASHDASKVHDRHYDYKKCKELGLNVLALEDNQVLQDKVLSLYHCYLLSVYKIPSSIKYIENQNGQTFMINGKRY